MKELKSRAKRTVKHFLDGYNKAIEEGVVFYSDDLEEYQMIDDNFLGCGSSRWCIALDDEYVVKISKNTIRDYTINFDEYNSGIGQSIMELRIFEQCPYDYSYLLNPVIESGLVDGHIFIIQPRCKIIGDYFDIDSLENSLNDMGREEDLPILDTMEEFCSWFNLSTVDILEYTSNIGVNKDGEIKIVDYGFIVGEEDY